MFEKILELFGINTEPIIGIDISSSAIKVMQLNKQRHNIVIEHYAMESLAPGLVVEKTIKNPEGVMQALERALKKAKITSKLACIAIPHSEAITRTIQVSRHLSEKAIQAEIENEADRYIPYDLQDVSMDFAIMGISPKNDELFDILIVATKNENIQARLDLLGGVGLNAKIVDIDTYAMERAFKLTTQQLPDINENTILALLEIGAHVTTLTIFKGFNTIFTKTQSFGGQHLVNEIQARYGLSYEEAILARRYNDLPDDYTHEVLTPFKETIAQQIKRLCQFFYSSPESAEINYLFLTGGTANIEGLEEKIYEMLSIKTFTANPMLGMQLGPDINSETLLNDAPLLMNCCGLALRNICLT
jgi:type IV pilus assembly protein PilM